MQKQNDSMNKEQGQRETGTSLGDELLTTDFGNAMRFLDWHSDKIRWVGDEKTFYIFNGRFWERDRTEQAQELAKATVFRLLQDVSQMSDSPGKKQLLKWTRASMDKKRLEAMLSTARSDQRISVTPDVFDSSLKYLNVENGIVDLEKCQQLSHHPSFMMKKMAPVTFQKEVDSSFWDDCLNQWSGDDSSIKTFLQVVAGMALAGIVEQELLICLVGTGGSGKSSFVNALAGVMGDYAHCAQFETFLKMRTGGRAARDDVAELVSARLVLANEADGSAHLDSALIKSLTGRDPIRARHLYARSFQFTPTFILMLVANRLPVFEADAAMRRRIKVVRFDQKLVPDPTVKDRLAQPETKSAILEWCLKGLQRYRKEGLPKGFEVADVGWGLFR